MKKIKLVYSVNEHSQQQRSRGFLMQRLYFLQGHNIGHTGDLEYFKSSFFLNKQNKGRSLSHLMKSILFLQSFHLSVTKTIVIMYIKNIRLCNP